MTRPWLSATHNSEFHAIVEVQNLLISHGYSVYVDGNFSPTTSRAVVEFQTANKLVPDGNVGPETWAALEGAKPKAAPKKKAAAKKAPAKKQTAKKAPAKKKAAK